MDEDELDDEAFAECVIASMVEVVKIKGTVGPSFAWNMPFIFLLFYCCKLFGLSYKLATFIKLLGSFNYIINEIVFNFLVKYGGSVYIAINAFRFYVQYGIRNLLAIDKGLMSLLSCYELGMASLIKHDAPTAFR